MTDCGKSQALVPPLAWNWDIVLKNLYHPPCRCVLADPITARAHRRHFLIQARLIIQFNFGQVNTLLCHLNSCLALQRERRLKLQKILCTAGTDGFKYYQQERAGSAAVFRPLWTQPAYIQLQLREKSGSLGRDFAFGHNYTLILTGLASCFNLALDNHCPMSTH